MNSFNPKKLFSYLPSNIKFLGLVSFLNDLSSDMIFPVIPVFLTTVLGASFMFVGVVEGIADSTASIIKMVSGRLSDRVGRRKIFAVWGYSISGLAKPLLALSLAPWHVLIVRFFDRVGKGTRDAPRDALISLSVEKKDLGKAFGFHRGADTLGSSIGPLIAVAFLYFYPGRYRTLFLLSFVASFFAIIVVIRFVKEIHTGQESIKKPEFKITFLGISFFIFLVAATLFSLGRVSDAFLLLKARNAGAAVAFLPILYFLANITHALIAAPAGAIADKMGRRNTFKIGMFMFAASYYLFSVISSPSLMWFLFIFYGLSSAFTEGVGRAIVADLVLPEFRGTAYGIYNAFTGLALLPASLIFGFLADRHGFQTAFLYASVISLGSLLIFLSMRIAKRQYAWHGTIFE